MSKSVSAIQERAAGLVKSLSDQKLIDAFVEITSRPRSADNNKVRVWLIDEIEERFPFVEDALNDFYVKGEDDGLSYDQRLIGILAKHRFNG
jgi:hypothetical protein